MGVRIHLDHVDRNVPGGRKSGELELHLLAKAATGA
jgi:hypothetical protein